MTFTCILEIDHKPCNRVTEVRQDCWTAVEHVPLDLVVVGSKLKESLLFLVELFLSVSLKKTLEDDQHD